MGFYSHSVATMLLLCCLRGCCLHLVHHVLLLIELTLVLSGCVLVLLVLGHKVVHVRLSLSELHLVHALTSVPVEEGLATEHAGELLRDTLPELLDGGGVTDEDGCHLQALRWDVANRGLNVVRDPLHEVRGVLVLDIEHLLVNLLGGHAATEEGRACEVATMARIGGTHHVLGVEHLLGELWHSQGTVLLGVTGRKRGETSEEEVQTREWDEIDSQLAQVGVQLTREAQAGGHTRHTGGAQVVEVAICWGGELECTEADVIQGLVVKTHALVGVLDKLVYRESGIVWLDNCVRHLWRWHDREGEHHTVGVLFTDLGDEQSSHTGTGPASEGVAELEALKTIARLGLLADNIKHGIDQLSALGVVTLGPVIASASLAEDEVVGTEELTERTSTDGVHGAGLEIHQDGAGYVAASSGLVVVHVDALELQVGVAVVCAGGVDAMLVGDDLPELGTNLVTALASLHVNEFSHLCLVCCPH